jgi:2-hydroxycyclohexanecarboxyl-CoA dehydrogenase
MGQGRLVVVTGGARGIGEAICHRLASDGNRVAILDVNVEGARQVAGSLPGGVGSAYECDVADAGSVSEAAKVVLSEHGSPFSVVMNVGWSTHEKFVDTDFSLQQKIIDINYAGSLNVTREFLPSMIERASGSLVYIGSDAARGGVAGQAVYAGAKAALIGFTKSLALELARHSITCNVVCPGTTDTPLSREAFDEEALQKRLRAHPMRRFGKPEDIANAVSFFVDPAANFVTGQVISVSGGQLRAG